MSVNKLNEEDLKLCAQLWEKCEPKFRRICDYRLNSCISEIDEVISDTYLALCNAYSHEEKPRLPEQWLHGVFNNLLKMKYEEMSNKRQKLVSMSQNVEHALIYDVDFIDEMVDEEAIEKLKKEVEAELNDTERLILDLVHNKHYSLRRVAAILDTTEDAAKQRSYRLRIRVTSLVKEKIKKFYKF